MAETRQRCFVQVQLFISGAVQNSMVRIYPLLSSPLVLTDIWAFLFGALQTEYA